MSSEISEQVSVLFDQFTQSISINLNQVASHEVDFTFPSISPSFLESFLDEMKSIFQQEPSLLEIDGKVIIVGDLHGHYLDLCRIFKTFQEPISHKYLFLGDMIDNGEFSIETVLLIFILKYLYPRSVYLIRGNHEFQSVCSGFGFLSEIQNCFNNEQIFNSFIDVFSYLSFGALIQNKILCIHGGISSEFTSINQIKSIEKPVDNFNKYPFLAGILWSDPLEETSRFLPSPRGAGQNFGKPQLANFLNLNSLRLVVRGHECVYNGIKTMFDKKIVTVFSASNYCGKIPNKSGVLIVNEDGQVEKKIFPRFQYLTREIFNSDLNSSISLIPRTSVSQPVCTKQKFAKTNSMVMHPIKPRVHFHVNVPICFTKKLSK